MNRFKTAIVIWISIIGVHSRWAQCICASKRLGPEPPPPRGFEMGAGRLELPTFRLSNEHSAIELRARIGVEGFEPSMAVPKTAALPLGYTPAWIKIVTLHFKYLTGMYFRGSSSMARILGFKLRGGGSIPSSPVFTIPVILSASGLEPETNGLKGHCSTNWATRPYHAVATTYSLRESNPR